MSFGKVYGFNGNPRTSVLQVLAKENNLDIELVDTQPRKGVSADYLKLHKLGKIPTFVGKDGFVLTEAPAIAIYFTSQNEKTTLLGKTKQDYALILQWCNFINMELLPHNGQWIRILNGGEPFNKRNLDIASGEAHKALKVLDDHLLVNTYLVGERITLADIYAAVTVGRGFQFVLDKKVSAQYPHLTRWWYTVSSQPNFKAVLGEPKIIDEAIKFTPPAKEKAPPKAQEPKKEKPAAAAAAADDEDEAPAAPKAKHPIEELGRATFAIDDWKRKYKNEETREVALPWFWQNMNFEEYSIWQVDYKYNDELTMTFMTSNLIGGFFARLEASRKYIMGCASVYGVTNDSVVKGAFVIRGQQALPAFDVAPDYESYEFTKLDPKNPAHKELVDSMWAWDKPVVVNGKPYEWADGKIFV